MPLRLAFKPGEAVQVDFGAGPPITDVHTGEIFETWFFVMTLAWSRHQYAEFVRDQTVATWLGCHRRAFEWFGGVVERVTIDNAKCAITRASILNMIVNGSKAMPSWKQWSPADIAAVSNYVRANFAKGPLPELTEAQVSTVLARHK